MTNLDEVRDEIKRRLPLPSAFEREGIRLKKKGKGWVALCLWHNEKTPSLNVSEDKFHCFGCIKSGDVFDLFERTRGESFVQARDRLAEELGITTTPPKLTPAEKPTVTTYTYQSADGTPLFFIDRTDSIDANGKRRKSIKQRLPDGTWRKSPVQVPYLLPSLKAEIARGNAICVVEGEKCSQILNEHGIFATTHAGGTGASASVWTAEFAEHFRGARVVVLPDHDEPGRKHAAHVVKMLTGVAKEIKLIELPLKQRGEDVVDWLAQYGGTADKLRALIEATAPLENGNWKDELKRTRTGEVKQWSLNLSRILTNDPTLRGAVEMDERTLSVRFRHKMPWHKDDGAKECNESDIVRLGQYVEQHYDVAFGQDVLAGALAAEARERTVNPLRDYLKGLKWDGVPRVDEFFIKRLGAEDNPATRAISKCWLMGSVDRVLRPGCKFDYCLVLEGPQGIGKSTFLRILAGDEYFNDSISEIDSKDTSMLLGRAWIVELAELEAMRRSEHTALKRFITQQIDMFRPPYGRTTIAVPRQCVFAATTNDDSYLKDPTGHRRFLPIYCHNIDLAGVRADRDQIWAEAVHRVQAGESYYIDDPSVLALLREQQAEREDTDPWEERIIPWLEHRDEFTTGEALERCQVPIGQQNKANQMRVAAILKRLGYEKRRKRVAGVREYAWTKCANRAVPTAKTDAGTAAGTDQWRSDALCPLSQPDQLFVPQTLRSSRASTGEHTTNTLSLSTSSILGGDSEDSRDNPHSDALESVPTYKTEVGPVGIDVGTLTEQPRLVLIGTDGAGRKWRV